MAYRCTSLYSLSSTKFGWRTKNDTDATTSAFYTDGTIDVYHLQQHTVVWQYFIRGSGSWQGLWLRSARTDSQTMAGRPEHCLSRPGEREPEPPNRAANLTNGLVRLRSHQPQLLQESPEKWHRRGDLPQVRGGLAKRLERPAGGWTEQKAKNFPRSFF